MIIWIVSTGVPDAAEGIAPEGGIPFAWSRLPDLPEPLGVAGPYAGVGNDALIVAGGAHFPVSLFKGGTKVWTNRGHVCVRDGDSFSWSSTFTLPKPIAYGASISTPDGVLCMGGCDAERCYRDVWLIMWDGEKALIKTMPPLPEPCSYGSAVMCGDTVYLAGGQRTTSSSSVMNNFWSLDLSAENPSWSVLPSWPGTPRGFAVTAVHDHFVYLFSGQGYQDRGPDNDPRVFLKDAYRYNTVTGKWDAVNGAPEPLTAAPSPGYPLGDTHIAIFGGNEGSLAGREMEVGDDHPGFSRHVWVYNTVTDNWSSRGEVPLGLVTSRAVVWDGDVVVTSGEIRPGVRSPAILRGETQSIVSGFDGRDYLVLIVYLAALVAIGIWFARDEHGTEDFFLAGRRIPWWAAGLSIFGTQLSAITFMSIPAKSYATDWTFVLVNMGIVAIAPVIVYGFLPFFRGLDITTAYEFLEQRFNGAVRMAGSASFILYQLGRMGIVLFLPAIALSTVTGINIFICITVMGLLATVYTMLGGIKAVIWTDVLQVFVLMGGVILSLVLVITDIDGGIPRLIAEGSSYAKFHVFDWRPTFNAPTVWVILLAWIGNLVPYASDQTVIQRYLTTRDRKSAARGIWTNAVLTIPASLLFFGMGTALFVFYRLSPEKMNPVLSTDAVFPWFIAQELPPGVSGLVIAGVFAAAMSSLDSSLNSTATAIVTDFYRRFRPQAPDLSCLRLARWLTVALGIIGTGTAAWMAFMDISSLWDMFLIIVGLFGGGLAGLFVLGAFTKKANSTGALIGFAISIVVQYLVQQNPSIHFLAYGATGIGSCVVAGYAASLILRDRR